MTDYDDRHKCDGCEYMPWCEAAYTAEAEDCDIAGLDADWLDDEEYARELAENRATLGAP